MFEKLVLDNGLRLVLNKIPHVKSVSTSFFVGSGGCYEDKNESGISHYIEHMCFKGARKYRTSREISEPIEGTGGIINGGTDKELTVYWCKTASNHLDVALDVLTDILRFSRFEDSDLEKERSVIIEEISMNMDNPQQRADTLFYSMLWPEQPLGRDVAGIKPVVQSFSRENIVQFYNTHYAPNNIVVSIAGDIDYNGVKDKIINYVGDWKSTETSERLISGVQGNGLRLQIEYRDIEQMQICLGFYGLSITHPDRFAVDLMNTILGEGMCSRLFLELREKYGLVYEIGSSVDHFKETGDLIVHAGVDPVNAEKVVTVIIEQLHLLKNNISAEELEKAKELIKGRQILAMENSSNVANWMGAQELLTGRILDIDQITELIDKVSLDDLLSVADTLIRPENLYLAAVGPMKNTAALENLFNNK